MSFDVLNTGGAFSIWWRYSDGVLAPATEAAAIGRRVSMCGAE